MFDFTELKKTDCSKYVEKKGKFNYISWPYMVDQLRILEPTATIHARKDANGMPYFKDDSGAMVETYILIDGVEVWSEWLPVMDFKNRAIENPNTMDINKTIQRCKAKCISEYTGIGLYLYMGEDLPPKDSGLSSNDIAWLSVFCKEVEIGQNEKSDFMEHYGFTMQTPSKEFAKIKEDIKKDYNY